MSKIEKLTKEQESKLIEYRDKWMAIGLETKPANRELAELGIERAYSVAGLKKPKIVWCLSPLSNGITRYFAFRIIENKKVGDSVRDSGYGQHDANWLGFYDYFNNELKLENETEKLEGLWMIAKSANWFIPHENICWISERHDICKLKDGKIHSDGNPAIHYPDGFSIWALNGVRVPQIVAETKAEDLDAKLILKEKNAEVRREIVRKIGVERVCQKLGAKILDKSHDKVYELLNIDLGDGRSRPYLKMRNPSIGVYHLEGVPAEIKSVEQALNWRNQSDEKPLILT